MRRMAIVRCAALLFICCLVLPQSIKTSAQQASEKNTLVPGETPRKEEIGALRFLEENPEYDGRNTVVAIFDTGVDPGATGLEVTSDGLPKIIDIVDGSGDGDVNTSHVVKATQEGIIVGKTGKELQVNEQWKNPTGEWHVGSKRLYELISPEAISLLREQRLKSWQEIHDATLSEAVEALELLNKNGASQGESQQEAKAELEARVNALMKEGDTYEDAGPSIDVVAWNDGGNWRVAIDTSAVESTQGQGLLQDFVPMTNFKVERRYAMLNGVANVSYVCNIYEEGNIVSIVTTTGIHGTQVARVAAAHHPDEPSQDGMAPGAQIVSCKISDRRLNGKGTFNAFQRCAANAADNSVDIIHYSNGGKSSIPSGTNMGRIIDKLAIEHQIIFCTAAGSSGPALSSIDYPGTLDGAFTIGAYITPSIAPDGESAATDADRQPYSFTSRGPTADGALGVDFSAPGGTTSPVPPSPRQKGRLQTGMAMASSIASGAISLLVSGLKTANSSSTPPRIRRAVENTCAPLGDGSSESKLAYGRGLLQVDKAWEYLQKAEDVDTPAVRYEIQVKRLQYGNKLRGIYMREPIDNRQSRVYRVTIKPRLPKDADIITEKYPLENKVFLQCNSSWVSWPQILLLTFIGRSIDIEIDPTNLEEGVHFTEIEGIDGEAPWRGPLFRIPITVIIPAKESQESTSFQLGPFQLSEGLFIRKFLEVPVGATWMEIDIRTTEDSDGKEYFYQLQQLVQKGLKDMLYSTFFGMQGQTTPAGSNLFSKAFRVEGSSTVEIVIEQWWTSVGPGSLTIDVAFHGIRVFQGNHLHLDGSPGRRELQVRAPLRPEQIKPNAKLTTLHIPLLPESAAIHPLEDPRDIFFPQRVMRSIILSYSFNMTQPGKITPVLPLVTSQTYDSAIESVLIMLYNENKKLIWVTDEEGGSTMVGSGSYEFRVQIRHDRKRVMNKLRKQDMVVKMELKKPMKVPIYTNLNSSLLTLEQFGLTDLHIRETVSVIVGPMLEELPKEWLPGYVLGGKINIGRTSKGEVSPDYIDLTFTVAMGSNDMAEVPEENITLIERVARAGQDSKVTAIKEFEMEYPEDWLDFVTLVDDLTYEFQSRNLPLISAALEKMSNEDNAGRRRRLKDLVTVSNYAIDSIRENIPSMSAANISQGTLQQEDLNARRALIVALEAKLAALLDMESLPEGRRQGARPKNQGKRSKGKALTFEDLSTLVDTSDPLFTFLKARYEASIGRCGQALQTLNVLADSETLPTRNSYDLKIKCLEDLKWENLAARELDRLNVEIPAEYAVF